LEGGGVFMAGDGFFEIEVSDDDGVDASFVGLLPLPCFTTAGLFTTPPPLGPGPLPALGWAEILVLDVFDDPTGI
tara:strand:- start:7261 stop:7485 length:225 start_codon:yes stop_codon:yes gene_type:complete